MEEGEEGEYEEELLYDEPDELNALVSDESLLSALAPPPPAEDAFDEPILTPVNTVLLVVLLLILASYLKPYFREPAIKLLEMMANIPPLSGFANSMLQHMTEHQPIAAAHEGIDVMWTNDEDGMESGRVDGSLLEDTEDFDDEDFASPNDTSDPRAQSLAEMEVLVDDAEEAQPEGARACVSATGDFLPGSSLPETTRRNVSKNDDMTMVGLNTQMRNLQTRLEEGPTPVRQLKLSRDADRRQEKLEEALKLKQEKIKQQSAHQNEAAKKDARRKLQQELIYMDTELDARLQQGAAEGGSAPSQVVAAKWLLEYAYSMYPPPSFTKRRATDEMLRARDLRFRDATISALKVLQVRYNPDKNSTTEVGAEWAVMAEEISKHAFSLSQGINRSSTQEVGPAASGIFATRKAGRKALDDDIGPLDFEMDGDDVEDAD